MNKPQSCWYCFFVEKFHIALISLHFFFNIDCQDPDKDMIYTIASYRVASRRLVKLVSDRGWVSSYIQTKTLSRTVFIISDIDTNLQTDINTDQGINSNTNLTQKPDLQAMTILKLKEPFMFLGERYVTVDLYVWIFKIKVYVQDTADDEIKIEVATSFLSDATKKWFIGTYLSSLFIIFATFLDEFKAWFT